MTASVPTSWRRRDDARPYSSGSRIRDPREPSHDGQPGGSQAGGVPGRQRVAVQDRRAGPEPHRGARLLPHLPQPRPRDDHVVDPRLGARHRPLRGDHRAPRRRPGRPGAAGHRDHDPAERGARPGPDRQLRRDRDLARGVRERRVREHLGTRHAPGPRSDRGRPARRRAHRPDRQRPDRPERVPAVQRRGRTRQRPEHRHRRPDDPGTDAHEPRGCRRQPGGARHGPRAPAVADLRHDPDRRRRRSSRRRSATCACSTPSSSCCS